MKIDLTIRDASPQQTILILEALNGGKFTAAVSSPAPVNVAAPVATAQPVEQPAPIAQPVAQQAVTPETHPSNGPATIQQTANPEIDASGLPWDARIHAATKARNADGNWKKRRGVMGLTVSEVEAELRAAAAVAPAPVEQPAPIAQPVQQLPNFNAPEATAAMPNFNQQPAPTAEPVANQGFPQQPQQQIANVAPAAQSAPTGEATFADLMTRVTNGTQQGKIDGMYLVGLCSRISNMHGCQIAAVTDLMNRPVLIQAAMDLMTQDNKGI